MLKEREANPPSSRSQTAAPGQMRGKGRADVSGEPRFHADAKQINTNVKHKKK